MAGEEPTSEQRESMMIQTIIVSKSVARTAAEARAKVPDRFRTDKVDETESSFRFRQRDPGDFDPDSFRTFTPEGFPEGVQAVGGRMKMRERASEMLHVQVSEFRGTYPDIPLPEDIDKEALNGAFFVTLPIMPPNAKSGNGRKYSANFPKAVIREINVNRPEGRWGHLRPDERPTRYEPPAVRWLAAAMDGSGMAWGKLIPLTLEAKEHFRVAKATNARVATSIYGWVTEQNGEAVDIELESIDLADPSRAGIKEAVAKPVITSEMQEETPSQRGEEERQAVVNEQTGEGNHMPENIDELIAEMRTQRDAATAELETHKKLVAELGAIIPGSDLVAGAQKLVAENADLKKKVLASEIQGVIETEVKLAALRPIIAEMLGPVASKEAAQTRVRELQETSYIQRIGKALALEIGGPRVTVNGQGVLTEKFEDTDEKRQEARNAFGL